MIIDCSVYVAGVRQPNHHGLDDAHAAARQAGGFVWVDMSRPDPEELAEVTRQLSLHPLAVEDVVHAHQRPKHEHYGDGLFVVLKPARYVDAAEVVEVEQLSIYLGATFIVTISDGLSNLAARVRARLDADPTAVPWGPTSVLHGLADQVVDDYMVVMRGLDTDIDQIEVEVFSGPSARHAERIFKLKREVLDFRRAVGPMNAPLIELSHGVDLVDPAAQPYFRDVHDHLARVGEHLVTLDALLDSALNANVAQVGMRQNEDMRKISAWVAIVAVPTLIAGVYGMNFDHMPELRWRFGYPLALTAMAAICLGMYLNFKKRKWL